MFYAAERPICISDKAKMMIDDESLSRLDMVKQTFDIWNDWTEDALEQCIRELSERNGIKMGEVMQPIRVALTGTTVSPSIFEVLAILGREESLARICDAMQNRRETE